MKKAGIIGLGLIGGSLAKALKKQCGFSHIAALSRSENVLIEAYKESVIDEYSTCDLEIFSDCDIIFICTPVDLICEYVKKLLPIIKKDCILTDVGSTKNTIFTELLSYKTIHFIAGHPMAGSEQAGYSASTETLFKDSYYILSPMPQVSQKSIDAFLSIIDGLGARPIVISAAEHDFLAAAISHVPHIIAANMVNLVHRYDNENEDMKALAAGGFKGITRIASASPEIWSAICRQNKESILEMLGYFKESLLDFETNLSQDHDDKIYNFFSDAKTFRDKL